jgi:hypothetical protein
MLPAVRVGYVIPLAGDTFSYKPTQTDQLWSSHNGMVCIRVLRQIPEDPTGSLMMHCKEPFYSTRDATRW